MFSTSAEARNAGWYSRRHREKSQTNERAHERRARKRDEAEARNALTPPHRRRDYRRRMAA